ncbi:adenosylcobinamide-GDP ribazoletransferase [Sulfuracidifex metallicus]|uniref:adenosylcobinamide-GDP ribazoletransferase n=1 Tax=Sulfuracidifex metallicus TaxID=47303 RepID=UPI0022756FD2|nr:adenosylcobinamide-GDP ribazoletransferase [Sulfuracidifex metallicus]MCY0850717.1 adenosylcobinamide-GDP ribazoletransferase [Sulfuracidifex metallicus]
MRKLKAVIAQLEFFSIIPVKIDLSLDEIASASIVAPLFVGMIAGLIDFATYYLGWMIVGIVAKYILIAEVELFRGFHHLDGLLDTGDALMIVDKEKKMIALKDVQVGAGGIGMTLIYLSLMLVSLSLFSSPSLGVFATLVSAEILARGVGLLSLLGKPLQGSFLGSTFSKYIKRYFYVILITIIPFISIGGAVALLFSVILILIFERNLGGSSGDLVGAVITLSFPIFIIGELKCLESLFWLFLSIF